ncbi:hypothetical protein, partial [Sinosporangium siamense]
ARDRDARDDRPSDRAKGNESGSKDEARDSPEKRGPAKEEGKESKGERSREPGADGYPKPGEYWEGSDDWYPDDREIGPARDGAMTSQSAPPVPEGLRLASDGTPVIDPPDRRGVER